MAFSPFSVGLELQPAGVDQRWVRIWVLDAAARPLVPCRLVALSHQRRPHSLSFSHQQGMKKGPTMTGAKRPNRRGRCQLRWVPFTGQFQPAAVTAWVFQKLSGAAAAWSASESRPPTASRRRLSGCRAWSAPAWRWCCRPCLRPAGGSRCRSRCGWRCRPTGGRSGCWARLRNSCAGPGPEGASSLAKITVFRDARQRGAPANSQRFTFFAPWPTD